MFLYENNCLYLDKGISNNSKTSSSEIDANSTKVSSEQTLIQTANTTPISTKRINVRVKERQKTLDQSEFYFLLLVFYQIFKI